MCRNYSKRLESFPVYSPSTFSVKVVCEEKSNTRRGTSATQTRNLALRKYMCFIELRCLVSKSFGSPSMKLTTLLGIREILELGELEFPILLDKSVNGERIVLELIPVGGVEYA